MSSACIDKAIQWSDNVSIKMSRSVPEHGDPCLQNIRITSYLIWTHAYSFSGASSNRWVAFSSLAYGAQHDFNQGCLLPVCKSCIIQEKKQWNNWFQLCSFYTIQVCLNGISNIPSSPGNVSSRSKLVIQSQSFSSSVPHSQRESTKYAACSWS